MSSILHHSDFTGRRAAEQYNRQAGRALRQARETAGKTQVWLAKQLGIHEKTLQYAELGRVDIKSYHLLRTAEVLNITPTTLFRKTYEDLR